MNNDNKDVLACLGLLFYVPFIIVVGSIFNGWIMTILWKWFIVPLFHLPPLTIGYAIGLSLLVSMFKSYNETNKSNTKEDITSLIIKSFMKTFLPGLLVLGFGWVVISLM